MVLTEKQIPKVVAKSLESLETEYEMEKNSLVYSFTALANAVASSFKGSPEEVFEESLKILSAKLKDDALMKAYDGVFILGIDGPKDWNFWYMKEILEDWKSGDPEKVQSRIDSGEVLSVEDSNGERVPVKELVKPRFNKNTKTLEWDDHVLAELSDTPILIDRRAKKGGYDNYDYNHQLKPSYSADVIAIVRDEGSYKLAKINLKRSAADPNEPNNAMKEYSKKCFRAFDKLRCKGPVVKGDWINIPARDVRIGAEVVGETRGPIDLLKGFEKIDIVSSSTLQKWIDDNEQPGNKKYDQYFYMEAMIKTVTDNQYGLSLNIRDAETPNEYDIPARLPEGLTLEDFDLPPGCSMQIIGRAYSKKTLFNKRTGEKETGDWFGINILGARTMIDFDTDEINNILSAIGLGRSADFTDEGA